MELVQVHINDDRIALVKLNDPTRRNAMGLEMAAAFQSVIAELHSASNIRGMILTGAAPAFAAGGDLEMLRLKATKSPEANRQDMLNFYDSFLGILQLPFPVVAAINGHAIGAGMCLAMACDFRIVAQDAKMGFTFTQLGLHPGMGATLFVPRAVGIPKATDLLVSGRIFRAPEALRMGLVQAAVDAAEVVDCALCQCQQWLSSGPIAVAGLLETLRPSQEELTVALRREASQQAINYNTREFLEGLNAVAEKRPPQFDFGTLHGDEPGVA